MLASANIDYFIKGIVVGFKLFIEKEISEILLLILIKAFSILCELIIERNILTIALLTTMD